MWEGIDLTSCGRLRLGHDGLSLRLSVRADDIDLAILDPTYAWDDAFNKSARRLSAL